MKKVIGQNTPFSTVAFACLLDVFGYGLGVAALIAAGVGLFFTLPILFAFGAHVALEAIRLLTLNHTSTWPAYGASFALLGITAWCLCVRGKVRETQKLRAIGVDPLEWNYFRIHLAMKSISAVATVMNVFCLVAAGVVVMDAGPVNLAYAPAIPLAAVALVLFLASFNDYE